MGLDVYFNRVKRRQIGYFRKVNFLVAFFGEKGFNIETQTDYYIKKEDIEDLIKRCKMVLEDHDKADELLPTMSGFFFGNTNYDEYYFDDVKEVLNFCEEELMPMFDTLEDDEYLTFDTWY